ncbi:hypothetical protein AB0J83_35585 [Actinoplanes sp. NPDC049596]|uniref:hypothetical protein n=1 Tax=unclassified Actinoplanes TaxID=2626549 RepID=UPI00343C4DBC
MTDNQASARRRPAYLEALGAQPGPFAVSSIVLGLLWFPFRLWVDHGDPVAHIAVLSGLYGSVWSLIIPGGEWLQQRRGRAEASPAPPADRRRGALVGLAVGVPFQAVLIAVGLATGVQLGTVVLCAIILAGIVAVSVVRLRSA